MTQFVLTPEQATFLASSTEKFPVYLPNGLLAGYLSPGHAGFRVITPETSPFTPEEIAAAEIEAEGPGPWSTTREVFDRLHKLRKP